MLNRDEKIAKKIISPKDDLILKLHKENFALNKELSKQVNLVDIASKLEKEQVQMLENNINLKYKCRKLEQKLEDKETYINFNMEKQLDINEFTKKEKSFEREL